MQQYIKFIDSTFFGHQHVHHQEYRLLLPHVVNNAGKPPGSCSAGLLDLCTVRRILLAQHTSSTVAVLQFIIPTLPQNR
jgi:hypothetical protein